MTARFTSSAPTEHSFMRDKSWQHPARREHIHGRIQPLEQYRDPTAKPLIVLALLIALFFAAELLRGVL